MTDCCFYSRDHNREPSSCDRTDSIFGGIHYPRQHAHIPGNGIDEVCYRVRALSGLPFHDVADMQLKRKRPGHILGTCTGRASNGSPSVCYTQ